MTKTQLLRITFALLLASLSNALYGQYLVSAESLGTRTKAQLEAELGMTVRTGVALYKILYETVDVHGATDTASGLLVYPDMSLNNVKPMVLYQHGTTNGPADVPSRIAAGSDEALAYGSMGYITAAADYLGLGDNAGIHPYVHAASQASAGLDLLFAVTEWIEVVQGEVWLGDLFVSGYSQGGHAAAALQKELEDNWSLIFTVTASTPMSGPYSLSGVMYDRIVSDEAYAAPAYIPYIVLSYQEAYGNIYTDLSEVFKPAYVPIIEDFRDDKITTSQMHIQLSLQIFFEAGITKPKVMFQDAYLQAIIADENHPLRVALRDNDLYDWTPQAPTRLYYCTADEQVLYQNAIVADSVMRSNGAPDVAAVNFGALTHGGCAVPAIAASIAFFDSFILGSGTTDTPARQQHFFVFPNPATHELIIDSEMIHDITHLSISDVNGIQLYRSEGPVEGTIEISTLPAGVYIVSAETGNTSVYQKIVVNK